MDHLVELAAAGEDISEHMATMDAALVFRGKLVHPVTGATLIRPS